MDWLVRLGGDEWSLQGLCEQLRSDPRVWKDDDRHYYLSFAALTASADEDGAWRELEPAIARINDAAMALEPGQRAVEVQRLVRLRDDGSRSVSVRAATGTGHLMLRRGRARAIGRAIGADGTVIPPGPSRLEQLYLALVKDGDESELAYALKWWRSGHRDWRVLYNVLECIRYDVSGGKQKVWEALKKVTPRGMKWEEVAKELKRFRDTAGDRRYSGLAARHGWPHPNPISDPMSLREAEGLIRRLLVTWIDTKI